MSELEEQLRSQIRKLEIDTLEAQLRLQVAHDTIDCLRFVVEAQGILLDEGRSRHRPIPPAPRTPQ
jgi:hypothetical protein